MTVARRWGVIACACLLSVGSWGVRAQQEVGVLRGQVVTAGSDPRPVRRAIITVNGAGLPHGRSVISDDQGAFEFSGLPAGRYLVQATKAAHLRAAFGARPGRPGVPIQLVAGETRSDVLLVMARAAVLAGVLRTPEAEPVAGVDVAVFRVPSAGQDVHLVPTALTTTDDRGMYRVFDLQPGEYIVAALLQRGLRGNGDAESWTPAQVDQLLAALDRPSSAESAPAVPDARVAWAPIYFPGSASPQDAVPVRVGAGDERTNLDFTVSMTRMTTVEGVLLGDPTVVTSARIFFNASGVRLRPLVGITPFFSSRMTAGGKAFTYTGVPPGVFVVTAQIPASGDRAVQWARALFQTSGQDRVDVVLTPQPAIRFSGRVVFEGLDEPPIGALAGATIRVRAANGIGQSASGSTLMGNPVVPPGRVIDSGQFEVRDIVPETFIVDVTTPNAPGWTPRSIMVQGEDVLDGPVSIASDLSDVVVTLTNQPTRLSGRIVTADDRPGASLFIAVFPQDRALWRPLTRRITSVRADTDGRWEITALPPGDYCVVALTDVASGELIDHDFLDQLIPSALHVTLAPGEQKTQDLQIGGVR
jgi:uncharacterized protein (DUF2141 family)